MSPLELLLLTLLAVLSVQFVRWLVRYRDRLTKWRQFPGSDSLPIIGHSLDFKCPNDILPSAMKYQKQYGLTFRVQLGRNHSIFTADPRLSELILTSQTLLTKSLAIPFMKNWLGDGLITSENPIWKVHRRLITPTFHFKILEDFVPIFNKNAKNLVKFFKEKRMNQEFDAYEDMLLCQLDTICETAMGIKMNALRESNYSQYMEGLKYMGQVLMDRSFSYWKQSDLLFSLSMERMKEIKMVNYVRNITESVIKKKQAEFSNSNKTESEGENTGDDLGIKKRVAFLDHLMASLEQNGGLMSLEQLREEVDTFIFAGHETVSSATSFAIFYLSKHQDVQQKLYEELQQVFGDHDELTFEKLAELKYMDLVIKETLRLCPSVPLHSRVMTEEVQFDGKIIPKGVHVILFHYGSHRNEKLFEDPETFNPDRFLDEDFKKKTLFAYLPFNAGPRNCIGQKYAQVAMKCMLSILFKAFKFTKDEKFEVQLVAEGVLKSHNGVHVRIEER